MAFPIEDTKSAARRPRVGGTQWLLTALLAAAFAGTAAAQTPPLTRQGDVEVMLVKNALTAVNHGNLTGNYTVLRDLGSAAFRDKNSAAQLASIFQNLRERNLDMSPILVLDPQFTQAPAMNQAGQLQLVGFFPTQPLQIRFALAFQRIKGGWMIDTISVGSIDPQPPPSAANNPQARLPQSNVR